MDAYTQLLRNVNPTWMKPDGKISSQLFKPTKKDEMKPSVYDGDQMSASDCWDHFTKTLGNRSLGVMAVTHGECTGLGVAVHPDPETFKEHALLDFTCLTRKQVDGLAKKLTDLAVDRGWLYKPSIP